MTAFFKPTDTQGVPLNKVFAEDTNQLVNVLSGVADAGAMSLFAPVATPSSAPTVALASGGITGTSYQWGFYWITGIQDGRGTLTSNNVAGRTPYGTLTVAQSLSAQQATVSLPAGSPPTGAIGWGVARNKSGGATWYTVPGSEQFLNAVGNMPATFADNVSDASLVTLAPTLNTTGTTLPGVELDYREFTSQVSTVATSEAGAAIIVTADAVTFDGVHPVIVQFFCPAVLRGNNWSQGYLFEDGSSIGELWYFSAAGETPVLVQRRLTPTSGLHTFSVRCWSDVSGSATGGAGGSGNYMPGFIRIVRAA